MLTTFTCIHKDSGEKIKYDDYKNYLITRRRNTMFILRCRYSESLTWHRPTCRRQDRSCGKTRKEYSLPKIENGEYFSFAPVDALIKDNLWICPIKPQHQDNAYYSISRNEIVVPERNSSNLERRSMEHYSMR